MNLKKGHWGAGGGIINNMKEGEFFFEWKCTPNEPVIYIAWEYIGSLMQLIYTALSISSSFYYHWLLQVPSHLGRWSPAFGYLHVSPLSWIAAMSFLGMKPSHLRKLQLVQHAVIHELPWANLSSLTVTSFGLLKQGEISATTLKTNNSLWPRFLED